MLFTVLIGLISAGVYALRSAVVKLRFVMSGGRADESADDVAPFVIFTDSKRYWNVFEPICDEFEARGVSLTYLTASPDDPALSRDYQHITCEFAGEGNKAFAKLNMLKADIVLSSTPGLDVFQWKRSRDVRWYAHILHAISDASMYRMFGIDYYDAVLLTGEHQAKQVRALEKLRGLPPKELPIVGLTYMDSLSARLQATKQQLCYNETEGWHLEYVAEMREGSQIEVLRASAENAVRDAAQSENENENADPMRNSSTAEISVEANSDNYEPATMPPPTREIIVLLAPSWGASSIFSLYGGKIIDALLQTGYHIVIRPHPQSFESEKELMDSLMRDYPASDQLEWNRDNDNFEVLRRSDIMVSDFSGVVFDFALVFDRPVIYTEPSYDKGPYDAWWLDDELWTFTTLPKIGRQLDESNVNNLSLLIAECLTDPTLQQARDEARDECWACRGESAKIVVDYLIAKREELLSEDSSQPNQKSPLRGDPSPAAQDDSQVAAETSGE